MLSILQHTHHPLVPHACRPAGRTAVCALHSTTHTPPSSASRPLAELLSVLSILQHTHNPLVPHACWPAGRTAVCALYSTTHTPPSSASRLPANWPYCSLCSPFYNTHHPPHRLSLDHSTMSTPSNFLHVNFFYVNFILFLSMNHHDLQGLKLTFFTHWPGD